jgi:hypothetical protein
MYSGHGSAEWANAPRASITIERTLAPYVFEFSIGKRGSQSGWEINREGYYTRYFVHSRTRDLFWSEATDSDIAAARSGISLDDFSQVFNNEADLTFEVIKSRFKHYSYNYTDEELSRILEELVEKGKLLTVEVDNETVWRPVKTVKGAQNVKKAAAQNGADNLHMEEALLMIKETGTTGINTNRLRQAVSFGNSVLEKVLRRLLELGRIRKHDGRYFATEDSLAIPG